MTILYIMRWWKRLLFRIMLYCVTNWKTLFFTIHCTNKGGKSARRQHKQTWRRVNMTQNMIIPAGEVLHPAKIKKRGAHTQKKGYFYHMDVVWVCKIWLGAENLIFYRWCRVPVPKTDSNTDLFHNICKNNVKKYGESLRVTGTKVINA